MSDITIIPFGIDEIISTFKVVPDRLTDGIKLISNETFQSNSEFTECFYVLFFLKYGRKNGKKISYKDYYENSELFISKFKNEIK